MFEHSAQLLRFIEHYTKLLMEGISDDQMYHQPFPGANPPGWILGHLAMTLDLGLPYLGEEMCVSKEWHKAFAPGSKPVPDIRPSKAELMGELSMCIGRILAAVGQADPVRLKNPHQIPMKFVQEWFPTEGNLLAHLMTTHMAAHLGQLSAWRRVMGMPSVLTF